ncbi:MAG: hypothetical protein EA397_05085 [Deltaproteobacteria bacterium]|nr:MAG: hypothetical protein EA397_05085 [Deltaproteobacteria bacterium]
MGLGDVQLTGPAEAVWTDLLSEALRRERLIPLLRAAAEASPGDDTLRRIAEAAAAGQLRIPPVERASDWLKWAVLAGGIVVLLGVIAVFADSVRAGRDAPEPAMAGSSESTSGPIPSPTADRAASERHLEPEPQAGDSSSAPGNEPEASAPLDAPPEVALAPPADPQETDPEATQEVPEPAESEIDIDPPLTSSEPVSLPSGRGPCHAERGVLLGYAYAGSKKPGGRGDIWLVRQSVNVRSDYPRPENSWSARAAVRCVLPTGSRVDLIKEPLAVEGGAYWVPIYGGAVSP